jgi:hypothetical protein
MKTTTTLILLAYLVGGFGTFGYTWNHSKGVDKCWLDKDGKQSTNCFTDNGDRTMGAIASGVFWPVYWGGTIAIKATAP